MYIQIKLEYGWMFTDIKLVSCSSVKVALLPL